MEALIAMFVILGAAFPLGAWLTERDCRRIEEEGRLWREKRFGDGA